MSGIADYNTTPSANTSINGINIAEGCPPSGINDAIRQMMADIATDVPNKVAATNFASSQNWAQAADLASASTVALGAAAGNYAHITGTVSIGAFDTVQAGTWKLVKFTGILTLTNSANLALPGAANIVTAAGDTALFVSEGSGNWVCVFYQVAALAPGQINPNFTGNLTITGNITASGTVKATGTPLITKVATQIFTSSGTYTPTTGMVYCQIEAIGGGGGGGGTDNGSNTTCGGGGGGAGGYSRHIATATDIGASKAVTIGAAGAAGSSAPGGGAGGDAGDTSVGTLCVAKGGKGGTRGPTISQNNAGGAGGASSGGVGNVFVASGSDGQSGVSVSGSVAYPGVSGGGAASIFGGGSQMTHCFGTTVVGNAATAYGAGGGGGSTYNGANGNAGGGAGFAGVVVITEYISA